MNSPPIPIRRAESPLRDRGAFPTTHWSIVLMAGEETGQEAHAALATLCEQYWYPLYAFVRRTGRPHHEAQDCTQGFLAHLLAAEVFAKARPERGRFRTFLLAALRHFLTDEWNRAQAEKRGGGEIPLPLDFSTADEKFTHEPPDTGLSPDQAFDRSWALGVVERALDELRAEYAASGRGALFAVLSPAVWGGGEPESRAELARPLGLNEGAFKVALHRFRRRLGERLQARIAETVASKVDVAEELRYLIAAIGAKGPGESTATGFSRG